MVLNEESQKAVTQARGPLLCILSPIFLLSQRVEAKVCLVVFLPVTNARVGMSLSLLFLLLARSLERRSSRFATMSYNRGEMSLLHRAESAQFRHEKSANGQFRIVCCSLFTKERGAVVEALSYALQRGDLILPSLK